jgi:uncharacterized membrane protein
MRDETIIDEQEAEERHEAMDYVQHEKTWENVTGLVKWAVIQLAFVVVGLYTAVIAGVPVLGVLLIVIGIFAPLVARFFSAQRMA